MAYVADFGEGLVALDVSNPAGITLLDTYNDGYRPMVSPS